MAEERPCKLCGTRIRVISNEHGKPFVIDAKTVPIPILSASGERVVRYMHHHLAHAMTCTANRAKGGAAESSRGAPSPGVREPRKDGR